MKRLIICLAAAALPFTASASPELAEEWGVKAGTLYTQSVDLMGILEKDGALSLNEAYITELERFALTATRLGTWNDARTGAVDLGCIFRGMAEEAELQLEMLETAEKSDDSAAALRRLITMFDDAQIISAAAASTARSGITTTPTNTSKHSCPANQAFLERLRNQ